MGKELIFKTLRHEKTDDIPWVPFAGVHAGKLKGYTAQELLTESDAPSLLRSLERISPRIISECCDKGDQIAIEVYERTGHMLGLGLANYASIVDPEAIILTGGISHAGNWLLGPTYESFEEHVFGNLKGKVKLLTSKLNDRERDVLGASALAWSVPEYSLFK